MSQQYIIEGGLSDRMTWQFLNALIYYLLKKIKLFYLVFRWIFIFNKKVVNLPITDEKLSLSFWRHKQAKWLL